MYAEFLKISNLPIIFEYFIAIFSTGKSNLEARIHRNSVDVRFIIMDKIGSNFSNDN